MLISHFFWLKLKIYNWHFLMQSSQFHFFLTYKAIKYLRMVGILDEAQSVEVNYDGCGHGWLPFLLSLIFRGQ